MRHFWSDGYLHLGSVLRASELAALQQRIDDIMLGAAPVDYSQMLMQLDSLTGNISSSVKTPSHHMAQTDVDHVSQ